MFDHETMIDYLVEHVEYVDFTAPSISGRVRCASVMTNWRRVFSVRRPMRPKTLQRNDFHAAVGRLMRTGLRRYGRFDPVLFWSHPYRDRGPSRPWSHVHLIAKPLSFAGRNLA